jgi:hypothetical protein
MMPTVELTQVIRAAQEKNQAKLAAEVNPPKVELQSDELVLVRRFADFCKAKGVPFLPAAPATVALFLRAENLGGANYKRIFATAQAIERLHDRTLAPNPVATFAVRNEIARLYEINPPRSWAKIHHALWASLPIECRQVIENYADLATKAVRKAQNEAAAARHELAELQKSLTQPSQPAQTKELTNGIRQEGIKG